MEIEQDLAIEQAYSAFTIEFDVIDTKAPILGERAEYFSLVQETAFRAGWYAHHRWSRAFDPAGSIVRGQTHCTVRALVNVGDQAWIQPMGIIEELKTGEQFVDPLFPVASQRSTQCCIELTVTEAGLVAAGPPDRHRLSTHVCRDRMRPLIVFKGGIE